MENKILKIGDRVKITKSTAIFGNSVLNQLGSVVYFDMDGDPVIQLDIINNNYGDLYIIDRLAGDECEIEK